MQKSNVSRVEAAETPEPGSEMGGTTVGEVLLDCRPKPNLRRCHRWGRHHGAGDGLSIEKGGPDAARLGVRADGFLG